ncbi:DUF5953 family protein [Myxococcus sp. MISCRS1]|uniref:DUF5953 family protein n=1 Tax=unclassified Myxococcus TaxID=2648731 RepID=UPI001CBFD909|nr:MULTISPECIES: DUF5953 family protein [unclassified Myxococcus]MBZ4396139.1 DUF5953 family protein [Myxococcus sp. AS-1-15]MCY1000810.1 DUF5953 family protein [Myxococcus sp. MISCRS1]
MSTRNRLILNLYASALSENDGRPLAAVHGLERAFPGLSMTWQVSNKGQLIAIPKRDAWLAEAAARGEFPLVCNGDERYPVTVVGRQQLASESPGGQPQLQVHAKLPQDTVALAAAADVLEQVAEGIRALWGLVAPGAIMEVIADQTGPKRYGPSKPPLGLPALKMPWDIHSPETPRHLGWLNYWSSAAAQAIGFPDPSRDAELLSRARRTATGGWVVQLTEAPLDLDDPAHLDALKRAYERFPEIGGRAAS